MDQILDIQTPPQKIYKDRAIWVGTFLGGPLAAGYFIAENFSALDERDKATKTWIYAIIATVVIFGGLLVIPETVRIPNQIIPIMYTALAYYVVQRLQGEKINKHISAGGEFHSWWRTLAVALVALAITVIPFIVYVLFFEAPADASISTKTYGEIKHEIAFEASNISEEEVNKLAQGLVSTSFFDQSVTKYVYAKKTDENYDLYISVVEGIAGDDEALAPFRDLRTDLQALFPNNKVSFSLVVDNLDNVVERIE
jgi:hypothetical protein